MKSYTIHVELKEGTADDYVRLSRAMTDRGFSPVNNQSKSGGDFTYHDHLSLETVLDRVRAAVLETGKHFSISVNEIGGRGVGTAG